MSHQPIELDIMEPLDQIQRGWIRIPATIVLVIPSFVGVVGGGIVVGIFESVGIWWNDFFIDCLRGPNGS